jgi:hypothetical protein
MARARGSATLWPTPWAAVPRAPDVPAGGPPLTGCGGPRAHPGQDPFAPASLNASRYAKYDCVSATVQSCRDPACQACDPPRPVAALGKCAPHTPGLWSFAVQVTRSAARRAGPAGRARVRRRLAPMDPARGKAAAPVLHRRVRARRSR